MVKKRGAGGRKKQGGKGGAGGGQAWTSTLASAGSGNMKRPRRPSEATVSYFLGLTTLIEQDQHPDQLNPHDDLDDTGNTNDVWEGPFVNGLREGVGTYTCAKTGEVSQREFKAGEFVQAWRQDSGYQRKSHE